MREEEAKKPEETTKQKSHSAASGGGCRLPCKLSLVIALLLVPRRCGCPVTGYSINELDYKTPWPLRPGRLLLNALRSLKT